MWSEFVNTPLFGIALTLLVYLLAQQIYARTRVILLNPVAVSIAVIILLLLACDIRA